MRLPRATSIRRRLLLISAAISLLTLLLAGTLLVVNDVHMLRGQMVRDLEVLSGVVGENCLSALVFDVPETAERILGGLRREPQIRHATLYDAQGRIFARYIRDSGLPAGDPMSAEDGVHLDVSLLGIGAVEVLRELELGGSAVGRIFIHARTDQLARQIERYAAVAGLVFLVTLAVSMLFALRLQRRISEPILDLASKTKDISERGDYRTRVSLPASLTEIDTLANGLNQLLTAIGERESALEAHADALDAANTRLRALAKEISVVEERERKRLASELHDGAMQKLAIARLQIEAVVKHPESAEHGAGDERLDVGLALIREALGELRSLQFDLSPPSLYLGGLPQALQSLAAHITARSGIAIAYVQPNEIPEPPTELAVVLYQCARELVYNVVKHAGASEAAILVVSGDGGLAIEVRDDGRGIRTDDEKPATGAGGGYGLYSIRERLAVLGGRLTVESGAQGSRVTIHVPMGAAVSAPSRADSEVAENPELRPLDP